MFGMRPWIITPLRTFVKTLCRFGSIVPNLPFFVVVVVGFPKNLCRIIETWGPREVKFIKTDPEANW